MTLARYQIRDTARQVLRAEFAATPAFSAIGVPDAWDTPDPTDATPVVFVVVPRESKASRGGRSWTFDSTVSLVFVVRLPGNGPEDLEQRTDLVATAIEQTILTSPLINALVSKWSGIDTEFIYSSVSSTHIAEMRITFTIVTIEQFVASGVPLTEIDFTALGVQAKTVIPQS